MSDTGLLIEAMKFAAGRHSGQTRKGRAGEPYINHPIDVADTLVRVGGVTDAEVLAAALLHDTVEDTDATLDQLATLFGDRVSTLVAEVTDDKSLPKEERKRLQVLHAPTISDEAKMLKLSDKICNVVDVVGKPPLGWTDQRRIAYLEWTARVVHGCRGVNQRLEECYDMELTAGLKNIPGHA